MEGLEVPMVVDRPGVALPGVARRAADLLAVVQPEEGQEVVVRGVAVPREEALKVEGLGVALQALVRALARVPAAVCP